MNFVEGTLSRTEKGWRLAAGDAVLPLGPGAPGPEGRKVVFGIRPEHLGVGPVAAGVPAEVEVIEPTGASTYVFTRIAGAPPSPPSSPTAAGFPPPASASVWSRSPTGSICSMPRPDSGWRRCSRGGRRGLKKASRLTLPSGSRSGRDHRRDR